MKQKYSHLVWVAAALVFGILACNLPASAPAPGSAQTQIPQNGSTPNQPGAGAAPTTTPIIIVVTATPEPATITPIPPTATIAPTATPWPSPSGQQLMRPNGSIVATYFTQAPAIDGNLGDWSLGTFIVDKVVFGSQNWSSVNDLSGSVMVGWDDSYLYIGARVLDDVYVQNATGNHLYQGDSLEILMDTDLAIDFYTNQLSPDDFQLGISPGLPTLGNNPEAYLWFPTSMEGYRPQVKVAAQKTDLGYDIEAAIPWNAFGITPQPWGHYGFCFSLSDNDKVGDIVQQSMVSNVPNRHLTRPTTWGDLTLSR